MTNGSVSVNIVTYQRLKKAYKKAVTDGKTQFVFEGNMLLTDYAKYLLQFMEMKLGIKK
jgi:hypothetical protein